MNSTHKLVALFIFLEPRALEIKDVVEAVADHLAAHPENKIENIYAPLSYAEIDIFTSAKQLLKTRLIAVSEVMMTEVRRLYDENSKIFELGKLLDIDLGDVDSTVSDHGDVDKTE